MKISRDFLGISSLDLSRILERQILKQKFFFGKLEEIGVKNVYKTLLHTSVDRK